MSPQLEFFGVSGEERAGCTEGGRERAAPIKIRELKTVGLKIKNRSVSAGSQVLLRLGLLGLLGLLRIGFLLG